MKVLVVDDTKLDRALLENILGQNGILVTTARDGEEAISAYKKDDFDAALIDWRMPPAGGLSLCQEIRDHDREIGKYCYIIMVTGKKDTEDEIRAFEAGVDDYISKPVKEEVLMARMKAGLRMVEESRKLTGRT